MQEPLRPRRVCVQLTWWQSWAPVLAPVPSHPAADPEAAAQGSMEAWPGATWHRLGPALSSLPSSQVPTGAETPQRMGTVVRGPPWPRNENQRKSGGSLIWGTGVCFWTRLAWI